MGENSSIFVCQHNTLLLKSIQRQVSMVGKIMNIHTKEHTSKFFESSDDGMLFFCHCSLILLRLCQPFARSRRLASLLG
jgi:hypothetical protein